MCPQNLVDGSAVRPPVRSSREAAGRQAWRASAPECFVGREEEIALVLEALVRIGSAGTVVAGVPGSGKSAFLQQVQRRLTSAYVLHGRAELAPVPYHCLRSLVPGLPAELTHPALIAKAILRLVHQAAGSREAVLVIDDAEHLDELPIAVIGQVALTHGPRVVLSVTDTAQVNPSLLALWRSGDLQRIDLPELSFSQVWLLAEVVLGAPLSREGAEAVAEVAVATPRSILERIRDLTQRSALVRRKDVWVHAEHPAPCLHGVDAFLSGGPSVSANQRDILVLVALLGSPSWTDVALIADPTDLDELQSAGLLRVDGRRMPRISLTTPRMASGLTDAVSPSVAAHLYSRLSRMGGALDDLRRDPVRDVLWRLKAGRAVTIEETAHALQLLDGSGDYGRVIRLIASLGNAGKRSCISCQGLVAALQQGHYDEASAFAGLLAARREYLEPEKLVACGIEQARLQRVSSIPSAAQTLQKLAARTSAWRRAADTPGAVSEVDLFERRIRVARAELAAFEGRFRDNLDALTSLVCTDSPDALSVEERGLQVTAQSLLLEANILAGHPNPELTHALSLQLADPRISYRIADAALLRVRLASMLTGGQGEALPAAPQRTQAIPWSSERGSLAQLLTGLDLLAAGRREEAGTALRTVVQQVRDADPHGILNLAAAALTLCCTDEGSAQRVTAGLPLTDAERRSSWLMRRAASFYRTCFAARVGSRSQAAAGFHARAADDRARGAGAWALTSLAAAACLGRREALAALVRSSDSSHESRERVRWLYVRALMSSDPESLLGVMRTAVPSSEHQPGYLRAATRATRGQNGPRRRRTDPDLASRAQTAVDADLRLSMLTAREKEIATLAATGRRNHDIAREVFLSVRTVEGHLYRAYAKLGVSSRVELNELLLPPGNP
ncbi:hypothetical protein E8P82_03195 [Arthrobacter echini]|uniref:HTH luxR-type domain-containing protein n=1 Tax=Arthrobacter echini TaxID=1529066 RepID=A0A4S5E8E0_9MICC|nr:LuxR C-terminal-related transcriptional regulator [Arthrobacter echini]THJ67854.1 hypothetical protein E8P82_03195 [Arthrobacter echini]